jgi:hypothetical protein
VAGERITLSQPTLSLALGLLPPLGYCPLHCPPPPSGGGSHLCHWSSGNITYHRPPRSSLFCPSGRPLVGPRSTSCRYQAPYLPAPLGQALGALFSGIKESPILPSICVLCHSHSGPLYQPKWAPGASVPDMPGGRVSAGGTCYEHRQWVDGPQHVLQQQRGGGGGSAVLPVYAPPFRCAVGVHGGGLALFVWCFQPATKTACVKRSTPPPPTHCTPGRALQF